MTPDYFAGLFDGEGTLRISFNGRQYQLLASLGMTARPPIDALEARYGGWIETRPNEDTDWKPVFIWRGSSKAAVALLDDIEGRLLVKDAHVAVAREFQALLTERTERLDPRKRELYLRMKELNRRGR